MDSKLHKTMEVMEVNYESCVVLVTRSRCRSSETHIEGVIARWARNGTRDHHGRTALPPVGRQLKEEEFGAKRE